MTNRPSVHVRWVIVSFGILVLASLGFKAPPLAAQQAAGQEAEQAAQEEKKEADIPKAPKDDFMVQIYQALDQSKQTKLTVKDKYSHDKTEEDVEIVLSYFNWSVSDDDFWNRQIMIETKTRDGFVVEKMVKGGFGELGYVKPGEEKTQDIYRKEKITVTGDTATAMMGDVDIGAAEKQRFHKLLEKIVLKK